MQNSLETQKIWAAEREHFQKYSFKFSVMFVKFRKSFKTTALSKKTK
eukprot:UN09691